MWELQHSCWRFLTSAHRFCVCLKAATQLAVGRDWMPGKGGHSVSKHDRRRVPMVVGVNEVNYSLLRGRSGQVTFEKHCCWEFRRKQIKDFIQTLLISLKPPEHLTQSTRHKSPLSHTHF